MKKLLFTAIFTLIGLHTATAQVGIGTETPDASALLELQSTTKGFLPPRMTEDDRDQISSPAQGLMIYCSNCGTNGEAQLYNGTDWTNMIGGAATAGLYAPDAPAITSVTSGNAQVDVAFDAPAKDGASAITEYTATSNPGNITGSISQAGSGTITLTGLTNGTAYTFTLTATNAVGISAASSVSTSVTPAPPPQVGDFRDGGIVFYVAQTSTDLNGDGTLDQGLVCAVEDQSSGVQWFNGIYTTTGATGSGIGAGQTNTTKIIDSQGSGTYAASVCDDYSVDIDGIIYSDWFLPSEGEMFRMNRNRETINTASISNGGSSFNSGFCWSSSETDRNTFAWARPMVLGNSHNFTKDTKNKVRAVRAF